MRGRTKEETEELEFVTNMRHIEIAEMAVSFRRIEFLFVIFCGIMICVYLSCSSFLCGMSKYC